MAGGSNSEDLKQLPKLDLLPPDVHVPLFIFSHP